MCLWNIRIRLFDLGAKANQVQHLGHIAISMLKLILLYQYRKSYNKYEIQLYWTYMQLLLIKNSFRNFWASPKNGIDKIATHTCIFDIKIHTITYTLEAIKKDKCQHVSTQNIPYVLATGKSQWNINASLF